MDIHELLRSFKAGEGDNEEVGEALCTPAAEKATGWAVPKEDFVPAVVATPVEVVVPDAPVVVAEPAPVAPVVETPVVKPVRPRTERVPSSSEKPKRGRKVMYDTTRMEIGESLVYDGKLASGRVLASLNGDKVTGRRFQATETDAVVLITRKA